MEIKAKLTIQPYFGEYELIDHEGVRFRGSGAPLEAAMRLQARLADWALWAAAKAAKEGSVEVAKQESASG